MGEDGYTPLSVGQNEFAYLDADLQDETGYDGLETGGVRTCVAVGLRSYDGDMALMHASGDTYNKIRYGVETAQNQLDASFDEATVVSGYSDGAVADVQDYLADALDVDDSDIETSVGAKAGGRALGVRSDDFYTPENPPAPDVSLASLKESVTGAVRDAFADLPGVSPAMTDRTAAEY